ncbi:MAG: hypothetical protein JW900_15915 [Anaerolineae bacterium]|nr:hypothetical protein [Anaerolineae bacterium]
MTCPDVTLRPRSTLDQARTALERVEVTLGNLKQAGPGAIELLDLLDQIADQLDQVEAARADVRAERARLASTWGGLQKHAPLFLRQVGPALQAERERRGPAACRPWWSIDHAVAQQTRDILRQRLWLLLGIASAVLLGWLAYEQWLAPPLPLRQALRHVAAGEEYVDGGDLARALVEFETASALAPDDPETRLWIGVLRQTLGDEPGAQAAYAAARELGVEGETFLFQRGSFLLQVGNLPGARADAEAAIALAPQWGYGFLLRAAVEAATGEAAAARADYERAIALACAAGDADLEALARLQMDWLLQYEGD